MMFDWLLPNHVTSLDAGPEFYNCTECSHNCIGGSEQVRFHVFLPARIGFIPRLSP